MRAASLLSFLASACFVAAAPSVEVGILHAVEWSPGDTVREGAGEFVVLLRAAQLQHDSRAAGLVAVGDHNGVLRAGGERALRRVALTGTVVAKIARGGEVAWTPDTLYVDAGQLSEERARRILTHALETHGAPPVARDPDHPTAREIAAIQTHLKKVQAMFELENGTKIAAQ